MSEAVIISLISAGTSILTAVLVLLIKKNVQSVHMLINSRMTELLELTKTGSKAEGKEEERVEQVERDKNKA
jgi:hypothetical protein